jgi:hypothetical protein
MSGANWNHCIDIHPYGDNIIVGSLGNLYEIKKKKFLIYLKLKFFFRIY